MLPNRDEELALHRQGYDLVAGVDEVGRGPLAGPVVAAAVVFPQDLEAPWLPLVRDSKALSAGRREWLLPRIEAAALGIGVGLADHRAIDDVGIVAATRKAMGLALTRLSLQPQHLLVDALPLHWRGVPCKAIIKGDARCLSIAAASVVAKVARDHMMEEHDLRYPGYGFARHKGYATPEHLAALYRLGPCPIHRRSFTPVGLVTAPDSRPLSLDPRPLSLDQSSSPRRTGATGERVAEAYLSSLGYTLLARNYRCRHGETDLVAQDGDCLVFVEVRTRRSGAYGTPEESVTAAKVSRLIATAQAYLQERQLEGSAWRIDMVAVEMSGPEPTIRHIPNAVTVG